MTTTVAGDPRPVGLEYRISLERLEELNRSPLPLLLSRLNTACPSFGKNPADIANPADLLDEIRAHCQNDDNFILSSMPLQEIVFRTLLLNGGEPMALADLHAELTERWSSPIRPITVTLGGLARVMDSDVFYGFDAVPVESPEVEDPRVPMLGVGDVGGADLLDHVGTTIVSDLEDDDDEELFDEDEDDDPFDEDDEVDDD